MKLIICLIFIGVLSSFSSCGQASSDNYQNLKRGFSNPPFSALPKVYWWWLNGNVDTARLKDELIAMKKAGISGADIFEIGASSADTLLPAGPAFMSEESLRQINFAIREAQKLNIDIGLNLASSWNAGGSWVTPKYAAKTVYYSKVALKSTHNKEINLPFPTMTPDKLGKPRLIAYGPDGKPEYYQEICVLAVPSVDGNRIDTSMIFNVSNFFDPISQLLNWKAPKGNWDLYRFICANSGEQLSRPSPNSHGPIIDHFDSAATRMHFMYFINRLQPLLGNFNESALKYFYLASYEAKEFAWTPSLPVEFKKLNGYDLYKFLPSLFIPELFDFEPLLKFNDDLAKTFSELMINNHYRKAKEICNNYGLKIISEAGGPGHMHHVPAETLKALGSLDIPRGEFWYDRTFYDTDSLVDMIWLVKEIAAASHIYKRGIVEEEAFTSYWDWQEGPSNLKNIADRAFCEGMNRLVIHGFAHNPNGTGYPGIAYYAGTHYNDKRVWWPKIKPFNEYLGRISFILQKTNFVADVLYYYGENIPNLIPPKNTRFSVGAGYDYEVINTEILLNNLTVENGELVLPEVSRYKLLFIGEEEEMSFTTLKKLKSLVENGAIIIGKRPTRVVSQNEHVDSKVREELVNDLWETSSDENFKKGKILSGLLPMEILRTIGIIPDFDYVDNQADQRHAPLDYIHYESKEIDFYLIRNTTDQWVSRECSFRQQNKVPEIWNPVSGKIIPVSIYNQQDKQRTTMPLTLPPHGSCFVVFRKGISLSHFTHVSTSGNYPPRLEYLENGLIFLDKGSFDLQTVRGSQLISNNPEILQLEGEWNLNFPAHWGAPDTAIFNELISWTSSGNKGIQYFSGVATYNKTFQFKHTDGIKDNKIYLDLGELAEVAEVWLNDKPIGITWTKPYRFDITNWLKNGENALKIEVANTWSNRLTGDAITGEKFTSTNIVKANKNLVPWNQLPLKVSGLLGPVTIQIIRSFK